MQKQNSERLFSSLSGQNSLMLRSDGILEIAFCSQCTVDWAEMNWVVSAASALLVNQRVPVLLRYGKDTRIDYRAWKLFSDPSTTQFKSAQSLLVQSLGQQIASRVDIEHRNSDVPTKIFREEKDAIAWLLSMRS